MMPNKEVTYTISELADEFDITPRTLRHYEELGLLTPKRKGNTRIYSHKDRIRLTLTLRGRRLGFSLAEMGELFELYDAEHSTRPQLHSMVAMIAEKRIMLQQQQDDIEKVLAELDAADIKAREALEKMKHH
ncbi:MerR family transcriptional regulator [Oceanimonas baumannii]|uniref:DNA-binding transcriptional MerR regulator n=1 Tax=Oceanimonas baumannii TaxID=129578 RepID=A0A235CH02_9GAMM|nr:MerR family DNA-binding transcriptional regulator [Oceanimonas baumannii]MCC4263094.1 MerR family DNA-binding transcriptional regulator [Oceanimonas baumannii]OYD23115.1 MerR family transcriptional regulator [Oceanimonas baumannii]TDW58385.1 DNA-binding transcriptional MerR regulator [Oceanimonas baumannii]